jgi:hypothetical protein
MDTYLFQHSCRKEGYDWNDRNHAHIAHEGFKLVLEAPQSNCGKTHERYPILLEGERFFGRPNWLDLDLPLSSWHPGGFVRDQ